MHYGFFTYGTRGDVQPCIALAFWLIDKGHHVTLAAPENYKDFIEGYNINFHPLFDNVEEAMHTHEKQANRKAGNQLKSTKYILKYYTKYVILFVIAPVIIASVLFDQPTWGKIVVKKNIGIHIPVRKLNAINLLQAKEESQNPVIKKKVSEIGRKINKEDGLKAALDFIENYLG